MWRDVKKENVDDLMSANLWLALPAEMFGTLVITLLGCSTWITWTPMGTAAMGTAPLVVALTFGLAVATVVWVFSHVSGGHVNPALTTAALFTGRIGVIRGILYIVAQILGGILGAGILYGLTPSYVKTNFGSNMLSVGVTSAQGFGVEFLATLIYVLAVFASHDEKRTDLQGSAPLTIGLTVVMCHLFAIPYTRAGMNPARSFGPAIITDTWTDHWVFWVGPMVGGAVAGLLYDYIFAAGATFDGAKKCLLRTKKPKKPVEPEKEPLEEIKVEPVEIDESKQNEGEKGDRKEEAAVETDADKTEVAIEDITATE